jgi:hypothetical protein
MRGGTVYAGGLFTSIGRRDRSRLAALEVETGQANDWNPIVVPKPALPTGPENIVTALAVSHGIVYVGGEFIAIGEDTRQGLAVFEPTK